MKKKQINSSVLSLCFVLLFLYSCFLKSYHHYFFYHHRKCVFNSSVFVNTDTCFICDFFINICLCIDNALVYKCMVLALNDDGEYLILLKMKKEERFFTTRAPPY